MIQNRNKLIDLFVGNLSNAVIHQILEKAIDNEEISNRYDKEFKASWNKAKEYRNSINPIDRPLPEKDIELIKSKTRNKVKSELILRNSKGYKNINLELIDELIDKALKETKIV